MNTITKDGVVYTYDENQTAYSSSHGIDIERLYYYKPYEDSDEDGKIVQPFEFEDSMNGHRIYFITDNNNIISIEFGDSELERMYLITSHITETVEIKTNWKLIQGSNDES